MYCAAGQCGGKPGAECRCCRTVRIKIAAERRNGSETMTNKKYTEHILDNGLTVLLEENHSAPVISHWIWYRVGSRNEVPGKTGISHWVEHMLFRGSERYPGLETFESVSRNGGTLNACTAWDWTAFQETMPADRIAAAVDMEADRMVNALFSPEDVESERTVILSELAGGEDGVGPRLDADMRKVIFPDHPYGRQVIGTAEDLQRLTRDDLYGHYRTWYVPNNAVIAAAGDFETDEMLRLIDAAFGKIPARPLPVQHILPDGPVRGPLTIAKRGPWPGVELRICWQGPGAMDPDLPALMLLNTILAGPADMNSFGSSRTNRISRLFRKLSEKELTPDIEGSFTVLRDPSIYGLFTRCMSADEAEPAAEVIFRELENITDRGPEPAEITGARKQMKAVLAAAAEDAEDRACWLGYSAMLGGPDWCDTFLKRLESVTEEDISRASGRFLRRDGSVTCIYCKEEESDEA